MDSLLCRFPFLVTGKNHRGKPGKAEGRCREQIVLEKTEKTKGILGTEKREKEGKM